ncbi:MAG: hypothetical protein LUQ47_00890 [Methanotrichaceae archaeon]|nr:hypothetical protein [Methanotrichaceae archaeon]
MRTSTKVGLIVLMAVLLVLSFSVSLADDDCNDLRACVENCTEIQNCTMFMNCIENCTINATAAAFGEAKGMAMPKHRNKWQSAAQKEIKL